MFLLYFGSFTETIANEDLFDEFHSAVRTEDYELVKQVIQKFDDINILDEDGAPLLHYAVFGNTEILEFVIERGADLNIVGEDGVSVLFYASFTDNYSSYADQLEIFQLLLSSGANVNSEATDDGETPLMVAARFGHLKIVEFLISNGALTNVVNDRGETALAFASREGRIDIAELLILNGANINVADNDGWTALKWAEAYEETEMVEFLKAHGTK